MVILNFASHTDTIEVPFPKAGVWTEKLDEDVRSSPLTVQVDSAGAPQRITVPSNYGFVFLLI